MPGVFEPMLCVVLQGAKEVMIGERRQRVAWCDHFGSALTGRQLETWRRSDLPHRGERPGVSVRSGDRWPQYPRP
jgi:hypothetical protein